MGVETDLILDSGRAYDLILKSPQPSEDFSGVYAKGLDHFNLLSLAAVIAEEAPPHFDDPEDAMDRFNMLASSDDNFVGVWRVPSETVAVLKRLTVKTIPNVAASWQDAPFFELTDWDEELTIEFLTDVCKMLQQPDAGDQDLLMWVSA